MQEGERPVPCVNSYRLNSTKQEGACCVYQIPRGQVASIKAISRDFRLCVSVCMCETMNVMIYVSEPPGGMCMVALLSDSSCRSLHACLCINLFVFVFASCFRASLHVLRFFPESVFVCSPMLPVALSLCGPILSWIIAFKDMRHEFLIRFMFPLPSECDPAEGKSLPGIVCVCLTLTGACQSKAEVKREGL